MPVDHPASAQNYSIFLNNLLARHRPSTLVEGEELSAIVKYLGVLAEHRQPAGQPKRFQLGLLLFTVEASKDESLAPTVSIAIPCRYSGEKPLPFISFRSFHPQDDRIDDVANAQLNQHFHITLDEVDRDSASQMPQGYLPQGMCVVAVELQGDLVKVVVGARLRADVLPIARRGMRPLNANAYHEVDVTNFIAKPTLQPPHFARACLRVLTLGQGW